MIGPPPSRGSEILTWAASAQLLLAVTSEVFFFAVMLLVPAVIALYVNLATTHRIHAIVGCGIVGVTLPVLCVLAIVHGRLMYPVYDIQVRTPEVAEFVVATYYGGLHATAELFAVATFVLSLAIRRRAEGKNVAYLGFATAAFDVAGSFPWASGPIVGLVFSFFFAAWFVAVGVSLYRTPARKGNSTSQLTDAEPMGSAGLSATRSAAHRLVAS